MESHDALDLLRRTPAGDAIKTLDRKPALPVLGMRKKYVSPSEMGDWAYCAELHALRSSGKLRDFAPTSREARVIAKTQARGDKRHDREAKRAVVHQKSKSRVAIAAVVATLLVAAGAAVSLGVI